MMTGAPGAGMNSGRIRLDIATTMTATTTGGGTATGVTIVGMIAMTGAAK